MENKIKAHISEVLEDARVEVLDPREDGIHLEAIVISESFKDLSLIKRQRIVMGALKDLFETGLHALGLKTFTPEEWNAKDH